MNRTTHPYLIPNGDNRKDTATLLVGTADEFDIDQRAIRMVRGGFRITQELADALGLDTDGEDADEDIEVDALMADPEDADEDADEDALPSYDEWDYADLKTEVAERGLDTEDKKTDTLIAALVADDANNASGNRAGENEE